MTRTGGVERSSVEMVGDEGIHRTPVERHGWNGRRDPQRDGPGNRIASRRAVLKPNDVPTSLNDPGARSVPPLRLPALYLSV